MCAVYGDDGDFVFLESWVMIGYCDMHSKGDDGQCLLCIKK